MIGALHFIGITDTRTLRSAILAFGVPTFIHRFNDQRAQAEIMPGDTVVYACDPDDVKRHAYDDSAHF